MLIVCVERGNNTQLNSRVIESTNYATKQTPYSYTEILKTVFSIYNTDISILPVHPQDTVSKNVVTSVRFE